MELNPQLTAFFTNSIILASLSGIAISLKSNVACHLLFLLVRTLLHCSSFLARETLGLLVGPLTLAHVYSSICLNERAARYSGRNHSTHVLIVQQLLANKYQRPGLYRRHPAYAVTANTAGECARFVRALCESRSVECGSMMICF